MKIDVLDHGFVRLVEVYGGGDSQVSGDVEDPVADNECGIIEAARQSTQGSFRGWGKDQKLLNFLFENKHATPFEFSGMVIEVKAPLFVFREWHRHRTQSYNEMSARYAPLPNENYVPSIERLMSNTKDGNKQAGAVYGSEPLTEDMAICFRDDLILAYQTFEEDYQDALSNGVPKELARLGMPVGRYSQMRASANLRNWLAFLTLRTSPQAQWEIRQFAEAVERIVKQEFPRTFEAYERLKGAN